MIEIFGYLIFMGAIFLLILIPSYFLLSVTIGFLYQGILKIPYFKRIHIQRMEKITEENKEKLEEELLLKNFDDIESAKIDILYYHRLRLRNTIAQKLKLFIKMEECCSKCMGFIYNLIQISFNEEKIEIKCDKCRDILVFHINDKKNQDYEKIFLYYKDFKYLNDVFDDGYKIRFTRQYFTKFAFSDMQYKTYTKNYTKPLEIYGIDEVFHQIFSNHNGVQFHSELANKRIEKLLDKKSL